MMTLTASLIEGFEIILVVTIATVILSPILCWVLPDRIHPSKQEEMA